MIQYGITVTNDGNMTLTSPVVSDSFASHLHALETGGFNNGDIDHDGKIDVGESWTYAADHHVTQDEMDAGGTIANTASVTTAQGAGDTDMASVTIVQRIGLALEKVGTFNDVNQNGFADPGVDTISFVFTVTNTGNTIQNSIEVGDGASG